jgi:cysteine desulfurase family protein (TIGR01976 family)
MLNVLSLRKEFPALSRIQLGHEVIFADGPAGSQVPRRVAEAVSGYLLEKNANHGGAFATSRESDSLLEGAHAEVATLLGASDPGCVVFGNNMTTLTFAFSRALAQTWNSGDEIILSRCDHDANVTPWRMAAEEKGVKVRWIEVNPEDCTLRLESLHQALNRKTRLVAVGMASNAVGTVHPVQNVVEAARAVGALVFLDAVHYAAHLPMEVEATGADFVVCSAYKFFGPHVGILWGKRAHLERLTPYKVRPAEETLPGRWMTGTQNHEGILGTREAVRYLASLGGGQDSLRGQLQTGFARIQGHERGLAQQFLNGLARLPQYRVWGITDLERLAERVSTFGLMHRSVTASDLSRALAEQSIYTWAGNFYALPLTEALGLEPEGMLRIGFLHYNTAEEVDRVLGALATL